MGNRTRRRNWWVPLVGLALLAALTPPLWSQDWTLPVCGTSKCRGRVLTTDVGFLRICVPRGFSIKTETGQHGDQHHVISRRVNGVRYTMQFTTGMWFSGKDPRDGAQDWTVRTWKCDRLQGTDYRREQNGLHRRYITLNAMLGYAEYQGLPARAARLFDTILDSVCCGDCTVCDAKPSAKRE